MIRIEGVLQSEHETQTQHAKKHSIHSFGSEFALTDSKSTANTAGQKSMQFFFEKSGAAGEYFLFRQIEPEHQPLNYGPGAAGGRSS